MDNIWANPEP